MWRAFYVDAAMKRRQKRGFLSEAEAIAFQRLHHHTGIPGHFVTKSSHSFDIAVRKYVAEKLAAGSNPNSYAYLRRIVPHVGGGCALHLITTEQVRTAIARLHAGKSAATYNRIVAQVSGAFSYFVRQGWCERNPVAGRIEKRTEDNARERWLTPDEARSLLAQCAPWLKDIVECALLTGLRLSEICGLRTTDLIEERGVCLLRVRKTKNRRPVFVPAPSTPRRLGSTLLYPGPNGGYAHTSIRRHFPRAVRSAGLISGERHPDGVTFHTLRHTAATWMRRGGIDLKTVGDFLNQKDLRVQARYSHTNLDQLQRAARVLADELGR